MRSKIIFFGALCIMLTVCEATITLPLELIQREPDMSRDRNEDLGIVNNHLQIIASITIGTPAQTFKVTVDTGSTLTAVFISGCSSCDQNNPNPHYSPESSSTASLVACSSSSQCSAQTCSNGDGGAGGCYFDVTYGSGEIKGDLYTDILRFGNYSATTEFGAIYVSSKNFAGPAADGILGMAYDVNSVICSPSCVTPVYDTIRNANPSLSDIFSIYVTHSAGYLTLGGYDPSLISGSIYYTPVVQRNLYNVKVNGFYVANDDMNVGSATCIVDSGTSVISLPDSWYQAFVSYLQTYYSNIPGVTGRNNIFTSTCYTKAEYNAYIEYFPTVTFVLSGVQVTIPPTSYILQVYGSSYYCLEIREFTGGDFILGIPFFIDNMIIFDRVNNQIGFASGSSNITDAPLTTGDTSTSGAAYLSPPLLSFALFLTAALMLLIL